MIIRTSVAQEHCCNAHGIFALSIVNLENGIDTEIRLSQDSVAQSLLVNNATLPTIAKSN